MRLQSYRKNYRQLKNAEDGREVLPQRRAHQIDIQHQMICSENIHTQDIIQAEQILFRRIYVHAYMHVTATNENRP